MVQDPCSSLSLFQTSRVGFQSFSKHVTFNSDLRSPVVASFESPTNSSVESFNMFGRRR